MPRMYLCLFCPVVCYLYYCPSLCLLFFVKQFFLEASLLLRVTSMCISPWLPGATWMERDTWICQELNAGGTKATKRKRICRTRLKYMLTLTQTDATQTLAFTEDSPKARCEPSLTTSSFTIFFKKEKLCDFHCSLLQRIWYLLTCINKPQTFPNFFLKGSGHTCVSEVSPNVLQKYTQSNSLQSNLTNIQHFSTKTSASFCVGVDDIVSSLVHYVLAWRMWITAVWFIFNKQTINEYTS